MLEFIFVNYPLENRDNQSTNQSFNVRKSHELTDQFYGLPQRF